MQPSQKPSETIERYQSANGKTEGQGKEGAQIHQDNTPRPEQNHQGQAKFDAGHKGQSHPEYIEYDGQPEDCDYETLVLGPDLKIDLLNYQATSIIH
jgi:hypothetical protein